MIVPNNKTENVGTFTWELGNIERFGEFKITSRMRTGYANLMEHRLNGRIGMLFDSRDMITQLT